MPRSKKATSRRGANSAPIASPDPILEVGASEAEVEAPPEVPAPPPAQPKARRDLGGEYLAEANIRFGPPRGEVKPGTKLTLTDKEARCLLKQNAVRSAEE